MKPLFIFISFTFLLLTSCNSENGESENGTLYGNWYGYTDSLDYFELYADSSRLRICSSLEGVKKVYSYKIQNGHFYNIDLDTESPIEIQDSTIVLNIGIFDELDTIYLFPKKIKPYNFDTEINWNYFVNYYSDLLKRREAFYLNKDEWNQSNIYDLIVVDSALIINNEVVIWHPDYFYKSKKASDYRQFYYKSKNKSE